MDTPHAQPLLKTAFPIWVHVLIVVALAVFTASFAPVVNKLRSEKEQAALLGRRAPQSSMSKEAE